MNGPVAKGAEAGESQGGGRFGVEEVVFDHFLRVSVGGFAL